jgi:hypothetical protein
LKHIAQCRRLQAVSGELPRFLLRLPLSGAAQWPTDRRVSHCPLDNSTGLVLGDICWRLWQAAAHSVTGFATVAVAWDRGIGRKRRGLG